MRNTAEEKSTNFYKVIKRHLKKQYPKANEKELSSLCREVVFAPKSYQIEINNKTENINTIRENLADYIEQKTAENSFIPYSLDSEIADLIENTNCETSSMNEYYRWISVTAEIVQNSSKQEFTVEDLSERDNFIAMSNTRESEILLCLGLYEASNPQINKAKIDMLRFKLARLREMRSIVRNTSRQITHNNGEYKRQLQAYNTYFQKLQKQKLNFNENINLNLKLNINDNEEEVEEGFSYLDHLREIILHMMRKIEKNSEQNYRSKMITEKTRKRKRSPAVSNIQTTRER